MDSLKKLSQSIGRGMLLQDTGVLVKTDKILKSAFSTPLCP